MKLLIVDDDVYTREGLAENIPWELYGIEEVMQAENGKEALHTVSWYLPDLIITDIRMPQKNGIDFCKEAIRLVPECKIIFITGYMQTKYLKDAIDLSAVAFIEKPIQPEAVLEALEKAVGKIRRQQETVQLQKENISYQKTRFLHLLQQKNIAEELLEEICQNCGFVCARDEKYLCVEIRFENEMTELEQCREQLEQYLADSTDFLLFDLMPESEAATTSVAVVACGAKRQQEIRRKPGVYRCGGIFCGAVIRGVQQQPHGTICHGAGIFSAGSTLSGVTASSKTRIYRSGNLSGVSSDLPGKSVACP